jgi:hypothetical protein
VSTRSDLYDAVRAASSTLDDALVVLDGLTRGRRHRNGDVVWVRAALLADVERGALALAPTPPEVDTVADLAGWLAHVLGHGVDGRRRGRGPLRKGATTLGTHRYRHPARRTGPPGDDDGHGDGRPG